MACNPCCGGSLRTGTKVVAIIEIIWYSLQLLVLLGIVSYFLVILVQNGGRDQSHAPGFAVWGIFAFIYFLILCAFIIMDIVFAVVLLKGSNKKQVGKVKAWLTYRLVMFFMSFLTLFMFVNLTALWEILVTPYFMWVGYAYMQKLNKDSPQGQGVVYYLPPQQQLILQQQYQPNPQYQCNVPPYQQQQQYQYNLPNL